MQIEFTFDGSTLGGKQLVTFEELYDMTNPEETKGADHGDTDMKPIAKSEAHFTKWIVNYPFYSNIHKKGVVLYGTA